MDYTIDNERLLSLDKATGKAKVRADIWAASSEVLPAYDAIEGRILVTGSLAAVPSESKTYILDLDNEWTEWK